MLRFGSYVCFTQKALVMVNYSLKFASNLRVHTGSLGLDFEISLFHHICGFELMTSSLSLESLLRESRDLPQALISCWDIKLANCPALFGTVIWFQTDVHCDVMLKTSQQLFPNCNCDLSGNRMSTLSTQCSDLVVSNTLLP